MKTEYMWAFVALWLVPMLSPPPAHATKPSLPAVGDLALKLEERSGIVVLTPLADLRDVVLEIYGTDGLKVGRDDLVWVRLASVLRGQKVEVPFTLERAAGRTYLTAAARAAGRQSQEVRQIGELSPEQQRRNNACTRKDPEGHWIKIMGCPEEGPAPEVPRPRAVLSAQAVFTPADAGSVAAVRIDGDQVEVSTAQSLWQQPRCQSATLFKGALSQAGRAEWHPFLDARCQASATLQITVERAR